MKFSLFSKFLLLALTLSLVLSSFAACKNGDDKNDGKNESSKNLLDISGYTIVRSDEASDNIISQTANMKRAIKNTIGLDLSVTLDDGDESEKEILVGETKRAASRAALDKLAEKTDDDAYIIDITDNKIAIVGTTENATLRALKMFVINYVDVSPEGTGLNVDAGKTLAKKYDAENVEVLEGGTEIEIVRSATTLLASGVNNTLGYLSNVSSTHYPSIVELKYQKNEADNGKLIAHLCVSDTAINGTSPDTAACFMESTDGGKTWSLLSRPEEQNKEGIAAGLRPGNMAHLYELPAQVGDYPAGTLVYSSGSINYSRRSEIWVWYSTDCGKTWTQTAKIASGGAVEAVPGWDERTGVWEPFTWYENGYLYCFYSDDSDPDHDQKLVYKRSKDGVNWSKIVDVCTFEDPKDRPGMFVMTKMGNGEFFMVYEYIGAEGGDRIYYKKTKDITSWNPTDPGEVLMSGKYTGGSAPACLWIPAGGECGTLLATATWEKNGDGKHRIFVSFDYGETWTTMTNPLPYTTESGQNRIGYSPSLVLGSDGRTVYYLCTTDIPESGKRRVQFASFIIY